MLKNRQSETVWPVPVLVVLDRPGADGQMIELVDSGDGISEIVLDCPERHNALTRKMWMELEGSVKSVPPTAKVLLIRGAGEDFSSGLDLSEMAALSTEEVNNAFEVMERAIFSVEKLSIPVVALLDGYVFGGGFELALAADLRVCTPRARLGMPIAQLGILLSRNFARRIAGALGRSRAKELLLTGRILSGEEAFELGAVNYVEDGGNAYQKARFICESIRSYYPRAVQKAKLAIDEVGLAHQIDDPHGFIAPEDFFEAVRKFGNPGS